MSESSEYCCSSKKCRTTARSARKPKERGKWNHLHFIPISVLNSFQMHKRVRGGHEAFKDLICKVCVQTFRTTNGLKTHNYEVHNIRPKVGLVTKAVELRKPFISRQTRYSVKDVSDD